MVETIRIAMWSGPRNISTAMMRAWASRADTAVVDEPFYAAYLAATGLEHPMRAEILAAQSADWAGVAEACATAFGPPIVFQKHMCQHMTAAAPLGWMAHVRHAFLVRPPAEVAASFSARWSGLGADDLGYRRQAELFDHVSGLAGSVPPVMLARDVLENPEAMLRALCAALGVAFDPAMLAWPAGPQRTDGVWGAHWYHAVNRSTGFSPVPPAHRPGPALSAIVDECQPYFDRLLPYRLNGAGGLPMSGA